MAAGRRFDLRSVSVGGQFEGASKRLSYMLCKSVHVTEGYYRGCGLCGPYSCTNGTSFWDACKASGYEGRLSET